MQLTVLGSGSQGNVSVIECDETAILVDIGLSFNKVEERLELCNINSEKIAGILITHEHIDHIKGLNKWSTIYRVPIMCNENTKTVLESKIGSDHNWLVFENEVSFKFLSFTIRPFSVSHDASDPVGYVVSYKDKSIGFLTDSGQVNKNIVKTMKKLDGLFLESNYDDDLLKIDKLRPKFIKKRIRSRKGHLSNKQARSFLKKIYSKKLKNIIIAHMSRDCNTIKLALSCLKSVIDNDITNCYCASQDNISETILC